MILYSAPSSYYSMIARFALLECGTTFHIRRMDIHLAKEQLSAWYLAINPSMTIPSLTEDGESWIDSRAILEKSASIAGNQWSDANPSLAPKIQGIVDAHYAISIERLTFGKAMIRFKPLHILFPRMLNRIIQKLEQSLPSSENPQAIERKIALNQTRLAYFTEGNLNQKLVEERATVSHYLSLLSVTPDQLLFGAQLSSADIVTAILCARLQMIGEFDLVKAAPDLLGWFTRMQARPSFKNADIWTRFQPWRILLRY